MLGEGLLTDQGVFLLGELANLRNVVDRAEHRLFKILPSTVCLAAAVGPKKHGFSGGSRWTEFGHIWFKDAGLGCLSALPV